MPYIWRCGSARPAYGVDAVLASGWKPSGGDTIESPWLIQTGCSLAMPRNRPSSVVIEMTAGPYSRFVAGNDVAAQVMGHQLQAVADAQHWASPGSSRSRIGMRRAVLVDAHRAAGQDDGARLAARDLVPRRVERQQLAE